MDKTTPQIALYVFAVALPACVAGWIYLVSFTGKLTRKAEQPAWYRWLAPKLGAHSEKSGLNGMAVSGLWLALMNFPPVWVVVEHPYPIGTVLVDVLWFAIEGVIVASLVLAIRRSTPGARN
jgi:hypothetical protein